MMRGAVGSGAAIAALAVASCGGSHHDDRADVQRLANRARAAFLAHRDRELCSLLTPHARARALGFRVDFDEEGSIPARSPKLPQTCEQVVRRERALEDAAGSDYTLERRLRDYRLRVTTAGDRATIALLPARGDLPDATFTAVKTPRGWLIDDSPIVPSGH